MIKMMGEDDERMMSRIIRPMRTVDAATKDIKTDEIKKVERIKTGVTTADEIKNKEQFEADEIKVDESKADEIMAGEIKQIKADAIEADPPPYLGSGRS